MIMRFNGKYEYTLVKTSPFPKFIEPKAYSCIWVLRSLKRNVKNEYPIALLGGDPLNVGESAMKTIGIAPVIRV